MIKEKELIGVASGTVIGTILGGPPGALIGAGLGYIGGKYFDRPETSLAPPPRIERPASHTPEALYQEPPIARSVASTPIASSGDLLTERIPVPIPATPTPTPATPTQVVVPVTPEPIVSPTAGPIRRNISTAGFTQAQNLSDITLGIRGKRVPTFPSTPTTPTINLPIGAGKTFSGENSRIEQLIEAEFGQDNNSQFGDYQTLLTGVFASDALWDALQDEYIQSIGIINESLYDGFNSSHKAWKVFAEVAKQEPGWFDSTGDQEMQLKSWEQKRILWVRELEGATGKKLPKAISTQQDPLPPNSGIDLKTLGAAALGVTAVGLGAALAIKATK